MSHIKIIDDFLPTADWLAYRTFMLSQDFEWYYAPHITYIDTSACDPLYDFQFTHTLYADGKPNSGHYEMFMPFLEKLGVRALMRMKANLNPRSDKQIEHGFHTDYNGDGFTTAIYYMNTTNGYTKFIDGTKIDGLANRVIIFPGNILHTGTKCTDAHARVVLNFNYF